MYKRLTVLTFIFLGMFTALFMRTYFISAADKYKNVIQNQGSYTVTAGTVNGNIYDCNLNLLCNNTFEYLAAVNPVSEAVEKILPHILDTGDFYKKLSYQMPFVCRVGTPYIESNNIEIFKVPVRISENQSAMHVIGYTQNGRGVTGLELSYDEFLRGIEASNSVTYTIDGRGTVLEGRSKTVTSAPDITAGLVTTIDTDIQKACEEACKSIKKGAVVVMDINTGEIKAMVSKPSYDAGNLEAALNDPDSPLINRALYAYNVGSVFKLVIAGEALSQGISEDFLYECTGQTEVDGQVFKCHDQNGHGVQNMQDAMVNSCNTYFINLIQQLDIKDLHLRSVLLGFGRENVLATDIAGSAGNLPSVAELEISAEKSNFSFGQGKLLATPLQITAMTCAIANGGKLPVPRLIRGFTEDGVNITGEMQPSYTNAILSNTAMKLQDFMIAAVNDNPSSNARPKKTYAAAKTSTAQTGRFNDGGVEICQAWITGFFPAGIPQYAVTVLVEDGGFGNETAAPVFKNIIDLVCGG